MAEQTQEDPKLADLHVAMGEFLTECSKLENVLITMMMFCQNTKHFTEVYLAMLNETFGTRIKEFKKSIQNYAFSPEHRAALDTATKALDDLLPRRNLIVHGSTYQVGFGGAPPEAYRIGAPKGDQEFLNEFMRQQGNVEHSFTASRIRRATADCKSISAMISPITTHLVQLMAN
ncbi:hypothetical protein [Bradyrhizobium sp. LB11.1]|uniref:hypothetical protein n=1 Tax=Bradyrhizobium sp. LB11.1 TaxID=3156326 RepID=UPI0033931CD9